MNAIQYLTDTNGAKTSVVIPIHRLLKLSEVIGELKKLEEIALSIQRGIQEAEAIEGGQKEGVSVEDFLDEL